MNGDGILEVVIVFILLLSGWWLFQYLTPSANPPASLEPDESYQEDLTYIPLVALQNFDVNQMAVPIPGSEA